MHCKIWTSHTEDTKVKKDKDTKDTAQLFHKQMTGRAKWSIRKSGFLTDSANFFVY